MKSYLGSFVALSVLLTAAPLHAQEKYTIKFKELPHGESSRVESKETMLLKTKTVIEKEKDPGKFNELEIVKQMLFTEWMLERPDPAKMPTKVKRVYEKAEVKDSTAANPKTAGFLPYHGKTLLIEKKGAKYEFRIDGGDSITNDSTLEGEFNGLDPQGAKMILSPKGAVAEGASWKIDPKVLLSGYAGSDKADVRKAEGTGKLVKVFKKNGRLYGVIEVNSEVELVTTSEEPKLKGKVTSHNKAVLKMTYEGCIDGSMADGQLTFIVTFGDTTVFRAANEPAVTSYSQGTSSLVESWKELPKS